jgi:hypothetical protein
MDVDVQASSTEFWLGLTTGIGDSPSTADGTLVRAVKQRVQSLKDALKHRRQDATFAPCPGDLVVTGLVVAVGAVDTALRVMLQHTLEDAQP